ncbi:hypothetical protein MUP05_07625, partial [Candidatus Bathyarchaeota archaeon]|nr:hypothetical protein [Candidatus Bathyarchaeota archaeon]
RAQQKSLAIIETWRTNEKQKEVEAEALLQLDVVLGLLAGQSRYIPPGLNRSSLPNMAQQALSKEVDRRQWPQWFSTVVEPRIKDLENRIGQNVFLLLKGPWPIKCGVCGSEADCELDTVWIGNLVKNGFVRVPCVNPNCRNHGPIFAVNKKLAELIDDFLTKSSR